MHAGRGIHNEYEAPGSFIPKANSDNDYLIDRKAQKERRLYRGVAGIAAQDYSLQESMGPIQNHAEEKILPTDRGIVMARRMLYEAATDLAKGATPPALNAVAHRVRAAGVLLDKAQDPVQWAKDHLANDLTKPVYTL